jgi:nuclear transport factor 2 (NTF2) superfamily protein
MTDTPTTTLTWDAAKRLVQDVEDAFGAADLARIEQGFTEDVVTRFADFPEMRGREAVMRFLRARFARTKDYKLTKTLHCLMGDVLANSWDASWEDAQTGKPMLGRGTEIWVMRNRRIALWDATFNVWEKGGPPSTPVV